MFSCGDMLVKWLSPSYALHEIILVRGLFGLVGTVLIVRMEGPLTILLTRRPWLHAARSLLLVVTNMLYFLGLASMPFASAAALFFVAPLLITLLSIPVLGERVGPRRWAAIAVGLAGVIVMLRPGSGLFDPAALLPLGAACTYASMQMITRKLGTTDAASVMAFYVQLGYVCASGVIGLAIGDGRFAVSGNAALEFLLRAWTVPRAADLELIALCGAVVTVGSYLMAQAYRTTEATLIAPFEYAALPLAVMWGYVIWGNLPDATTTLGIVLIAGSGLYVFFRETRGLREPTVSAAGP